MSWPKDPEARARALESRRSDELNKATIEAIREMLGLDPLYANDMGPRPRAVEASS